MRKYLMRIMSWVLLLLAQSGPALSLLDFEGYARLEILAASTNAVVYQYQVSGTNGWIIEAADLIGKRTRWSLRAWGKATRVASPLDRNVNVVLSSRLLQLDIETGRTNAVVDFRRLQWPRRDPHPRLEDFERWASTL